MSIALPTALALTLACNGGGTLTITSDAPLDGTDVTDTDPGPDTDTDTTSDTGTPVEVPPAPQLTRLNSALHATIGTLIYARWDQSVAADVFVEYSFDEGVWVRSPVRARDAGEHEELLLGVPYGATVTWRVQAANAGGSATSPDQTISTREQPSDMPSPTLHASEPDRYDADSPWILLGLTGADSGFGEPWWVMIIDRQGRPVWGQKSDSGRMSLHPRLSWDGTAILFDQNAFWSRFSLNEGQVDKIRIDGSLVHTWQTPGLHHPHQELPDGSLAYGRFTGWYDEALEIVHPDDSVDRLWDCDDFLASIGESTSCASNTLNYDLATDTFLFSFWTSESVFQIDATSGETLRYFGHVRGSYDFDPPSSAFWYQHGAVLTDAGTLLISTHSSEPSTELAVREYEIDEANETLHQIWSFGVGEGVTGSQMGEAHRLPGGNTLHNYGYNPRLREVTPQGDVVWDIEWDTDTLGRSTVIPDLYALAPEPR